MSIEAPQICRADLPDMIPESPVSKNVPSQPTFRSDATLYRTSIDTFEHQVHSVADALPKNIFRARMNQEAFPGLEMSAGVFGF